MKNRSNTSIMNPTTSVLVGLLCILPFVTLNTIANNEIEPFFTIFKINTGGYFWDYSTGYFALIGSVMLLAVGAGFAIRPALHKGADGKRKFYPVNTILAVVLLILFALLASVVFSMIYRCHILQIPYCD